MTMVWDRLDQLADGHRATLPVGSPGGRPLVVLLAPQLEGLADSVPDGVVSDAVWLTAPLRQRLLQRSHLAAAGTDQRVPVTATCEVCATTLRAGTLHLGVLAAVVPNGAPPPWTSAVSRRVADALAAVAAPFLAERFHQARSASWAQGRVQAQLAHLDPASGEVGVGHTDPEGLAGVAELAGEVATAGQTAGFLLAVDADEVAPVVATLAAASLRHWLSDLPATDPATVLEAAGVDLAPLLTRLDARLHVVLTTRTDPGRLAVVTTGPGIALRGRRGEDLGLVRGEGVPLGAAPPGLALGQRASAVVPLPVGGHVLAVTGVADPRTQLRYGVPTTPSVLMSPNGVAQRVAEAFAPAARAALVHAELPG